jgi:SAM-dependent methyltransferase
LRRNPFPQSLTAGLFYREKMRAIHYIAPDEPFEQVLEVGGGRGGLTALLYPCARVTNLDLDRACAHAPVNVSLGGRFICGDATSLPFEDACFDAVTLFDVLEHIPDDARAAKEALRVLKPGGALLVSTPNEYWRFPYYDVMRGLCPSEREIWDEWGHIRSGYSLGQLEDLVRLPCREWATFISPLTVVNHDFAFSRLPFVLRSLACLALSPVTWAGYLLHRRHDRGTETVSLWQKDALPRP